MSHPLSDYLTTLHSYYPQLTWQDARLLESSGQFNDVICIDDRWIFRFPKSADVAQEVEREVSLLKALQGKLPLPIPNPTIVAYHPQTHQLEFMGYRMLAGEPLLREKFATLTDKNTLQQIASDIATFLKTLHQIPPDSIGLASIPSDTYQEWVGLFAEFKDKLFPYMRHDARQQVSDTFERALNDKMLWQVDPKLIHGDFGTGNILYAEGHIVGIIDFTFCGLGDPAQEVGALMSSYGESFIERVFGFYPDLRQTLDRARFIRRQYALIQALYGLRDNNQADFEEGIADYI